MIKVISVEAVRAVEAAADASGLTYDMMMQNAGQTVAARSAQIIAGKQDARVTVLVGKGNNGGDGLVAGRLIAQETGALVRFYLLQRRGDEDTNFSAVRDAGLFIAYAEDDRDGRVLRNMVASADLVLDAIFGIGIKLPIRQDVAKVLRGVNQALHDGQQAESASIRLITPDEPDVHQSQRPYVIAVDCPSGLDCDTGQLDKNAIYADETITFIAAKPGLFAFPGAAAVGTLRVAEIGVPDDLPELRAAPAFLVDAQWTRDHLPPRPADSHKGTFGKVLVVAGSVNYTGAAGLSSMAAYRAGAGLVTVATPAPVAAVLSSHLLEPTWMLLPHDMGVISQAAAAFLRPELAAYQALLLGPGWGREETTGHFLAALLKQQADGKKAGIKQPIGFAAGSTEGREGENRETNASLPPLVIDADALNLLSQLDEWWTLLPDYTILTPHPAEMGRLAGMETSEIQANRWEIALAKAKAWKVILVLKGAHTLIAAPDGRLAVLPFKTDALATAGTGDVLAGAITGLLAQGLPAFEVAVVGGYLQGLAGKQAARQVGTGRSVTAGDVLAGMAEAMRLVVG